MSPRRKTIHEGGVTNPVKRSLTIRDDPPGGNREVMYEDNNPVGNYAIRETTQLVYTNRMVLPVGEDYRTKTDRDWPTP
jgi:hypothetical protein